jgi:adenosylhomocysteine nucleosidase
MEGAAVAQVCHEHGIPFACVRTISDAADETGHESVEPFFGGLAGVYTAGIMRRWMQER